MSRSQCEHALLCHLYRTVHETDTSCAVCLMLFAAGESITNTRGTVTRYTQTHSPEQPHTIRDWILITQSGQSVRI